MTLKDEREAVDAHHEKLRLASFDKMETRVWHLMVSVRRVCAADGINCESLWKDSGVFHAENPTLGDV